MWRPSVCTSVCAGPQGMVSLFACALHMHASVSVPLLRSAEPGGMVWQGLFPSLPDGCARMPAARKDTSSGCRGWFCDSLMALLRCQQPEKTSSGVEIQCAHKYLGRPKVCCHCVCSTHACKCMWVSLLRSAEPGGMVWQRMILRPCDGCGRRPAAGKDILRCGDPVCARVLAPPHKVWCHSLCVLYTCMQVYVGPTAQERRARRYGVAEAASVPA